MIKLKSKIQKEIEDKYIEEMGISPRFCTSVVELNEVYNDIRLRISNDIRLTAKQKSELITASKFAQSIIQKRFKN